MIAQTHMEYIKFIGPSELRNEYLYHVWSETDEQFKPFCCNNVNCCDIAWDFHFEWVPMEGPKTSTSAVPRLDLQYTPRNMHTVFALLCFVVVIHWLIFPYPSGLLHWHCGNLTIAPVPAKQPCWIWINTSCEFIMNDCITTTKQSTTKPCAYFLGYTVVWRKRVVVTVSTEGLAPNGGMSWVGTALAAGLHFFQRSYTF